MDLDFMHLGLLIAEYLHIQDDMEVDSMGVNVACYEEKHTAKSLDCLESLHVKKGRKRKRKASPSNPVGNASLERPAKKQKLTSHVGKKLKQSPEVDNDDEVKAADAKDSQEDKNHGTGKCSEKAKQEPSRGEMHVVVFDILKEVYFNAAMLSNIIRQLGAHFGLDLMHRKAEVRDIIVDVMCKAGEMLKNPYHLQ